MKHISIFGWIAAVLLTALTTMHGNVIAQTPDGETPANEGVCDVLHGGTPGLYGLCVAYCEAQDLDSFDKEPPNNKILANYRKKMQAGDPDMPCVKVPCPCWSADEMASITGDGTASACIGSTNKLQIIDNALKTHFAEANANPSQERCRYIDLNTSPITLRNFAITPEQALSCLADVQAACASTGL